MIWKTRPRPLAQLDLRLLILLPALVLKYRLSNSLLLDTGLGESLVSLPLLIGLPPYLDHQQGSIGGRAGNRQAMTETTPARRRTRS